jgi:hypothetical protein
VSVRRIVDNVSEAVCLSVKYLLMYLTPCVCPSTVDYDSSVRVRPSSLSSCLKRQKKEIGDMAGVTGEMAGSARPQCGVYVVGG